MSRATIRTLILVLVLLLVLVVLFFLLRPDSSGPESSTGASTSAGSAENTGEETFDLAVKEGVMTPNEITVHEGDRVVLRITSDNPLEFHLHGYEIEQEIEPGEPTEIQFDATITGRFAIEDHDSDTELGMLLVQPR